MKPTSLNKTFPHNLDAEKALLGCVLIENQALSRVMHLVTADDFYRESHRKLYNAMVSLFQQGCAIDVITLSGILSPDDPSGDVYVYITSLLDAVPVTTNASHYAQIIHEKSVLRRLLEIIYDVSDRVLSSSNSFEELLDYTEKSIFEITEARAGQAFDHISKILEKTLEHIQTLYERKESITGVPTGLLSLDKMLAGLQPSDLIIIAARPSMGKTAFALNLCQYAAVHANVPVGIFSLEMSKEQLVLRMLVSEAKVEAQKVRTGQLSESDWELLVSTSDRIYDIPIYIDDTPGISILELRAKARRLKQEKNLGLLVVDYLQLMSGSEKNASREQEISEISRGLKGLAKELHIPVIALSQLNRSLESRTDKRPIMSDLRESGAIEQDADVIMFIYRDVVYKRKEMDEEPDLELQRKAEIIIGKQRNGPIGTVNVVFLGEYSSFVNPAEDYRDGL